MEETKITRVSDKRINSLLEDIETLRGVSSVITKLINGKMNTIKEICTHESVSVKSSYMPGGYLDRSQYVKETVCDVCGKVLTSSVTYGGYE